MMKHIIFAILLSAAVIGCKSGNIQNSSESDTCKTNSCETPCLPDMTPWWK